MFRELTEYGRQLEADGALPPVGFYNYGAPIRWIVHLKKNGVSLEKSELDAARPYSGRTSSPEAHLLADEAGYVFGLQDEKKESSDPKAVKRAQDKQQEFEQLTRAFLESPTLEDTALREAVTLMLDALERKLVQADPLFKEIQSKDWVSFLPDFGAIHDTHLFEHENAKRFWTQEMQRRTTNKEPVTGECAVCSETKTLIYKIPLGVKLVGVTPLHSLNSDAFVSHRPGFKGAHIGVCFDCADTASRAFNALSGDDRHRKTIVFNSNKRDGLENQIALFWLSAPKTAADTAPHELEVGELSFDFTTFGAELSAFIAEGRPVEGKKNADIADLARVLEAPWRVKDSNLNIADVGFNLGILSPNVGRIALREWITVSLAQLKRSYKRFVDATRIVSSWGDNPKPFSVYSLVNAVESSNPNLSRSLIRTLLLGTAPPRDILERGVRFFRNPNILQNPREAWRQHTLLAGIKLYLYFDQEENMTELNAQHTSQAYLCGRLLAVLEEAQQRASGFGLNTTLVDRFYGAASTAPGAVFGNLLRLATTAHFSKGEVSNAVLRFPGADKQPRLGELLEDVMAALGDAGGFPKTLTNVQQGEFALGFYHQRAAIRTTRGKKNNAEGDEQ